MNHTSSGFTFGPLLASDVQAAESLARNRQWSLRAEDWLEILRLTTGIAVRKEGTLVGAGVSWEFGDEFGAIGTVITTPGLAHLDLEHALLARLLEGLDDRSVWAHVPDASLSSYERLGFLRNSVKIQHQGVASMVPLLALSPGDRIRPLGRDDPAALKLLDELASGVPRGEVIDQWLQREACVVLENEGIAQGYAFCRESGPGVIIGPVAAPTIESAKALIAHWINMHVRKIVRVDVPAESGLSPWLASVGLPKTQCISTMIRGKPFIAAGMPQLWAMMVNPIS